MSSLRWYRWIGGWGNLECRAVGANKPIAPLDEALFVAHDPTDLALAPMLRPVAKGVWAPIGKWILACEWLTAVFYLDDVAQDIV